MGFRNLEPEGILSFDVIDPVGVRLDGDRLVAAGPSDGAPPADSTSAVS